MSGYSWDDDDSNDSSLVKRLREEIKERDKVLSEKDKELKTRDDELSTLRPQVRSASIRDVLGDLKIPTKVAKLIPGNVEPTKDAVKGWLDEFGDVLGIKPETPDETPVGDGAPSEPEGQASIPNAAAQQWQRVQSQDTGVGTTAMDADAQAIAQLQAMNAAAGNSDEFFAFLSGEKALPNG